MTSSRKTSSNSSIRKELERADERAEVRTRAQKKNYAERLSRALAQRLADELRCRFPGILPDEAGRGQESRVRAAHGARRLDVNFSTPELGLGLGLSIKTVNFPDPRSRRYTKNFTRIDNELRAEALDYHVRQPYAVLVALIFMPREACEDAGEDGISSFAHAYEIFRRRTGRGDPRDRPELFEGVFLGLYDPTNGEVVFADAARPVPKQGMPYRNRLALADLIQQIIRLYETRNEPPVEWEESPGETRPV